MDDEYKDFFEMIKKMLKERFNLRDNDIFIFPDKDINLDPNDPRFKDIKKYKISYHFEPGMDKPEIKFEGDFDEMITKYLKDFDLSKLPQKGKPTEKQPNRGIDAGRLTLEPCLPEDKECASEPYTEINDFDDFTEIIIEVPGIEIPDVILSISDSGTTIIFTAENDKRKYSNKIKLPFKTTLENIDLKVNNGVVTLNAKKTN